MTSDSEMITENQNTDQNTMKRTIKEVIVSTKNILKNFEILKNLF